MKCISCNREAETIYEGNALCREHLETSIENSENLWKLNIDMMHRGLTRR